MIKTRNWPIKRKLLMIIVASIAVSLVLVMTGIGAYELATYRDRISQQMKEVGGFIAANSAPTLAFDDALTAQEILNTLRGSPAVAVAALYTTDGRIFASYVRAGQAAVVPPSSPGAEGTRYVGRYMELVRPVLQKGRRLGTLYLRADLANVYERLTGYAWILLVVSLALGGGALLLQRLLQRLVSEPLLRLSKMTERIAGGDLTAHVPVESEDEMGQLAGAFNHMADELGQSYEVLRKSEERYRALINASVQALYSMSPDWSEMRQLQGGTFIADTEEPNSNWIQEYIHPDDQKWVLEVIGKTVQTGTVFELEHRVRRQDGTMGWTFSRAVPVRNAIGEIVEWFGAASDITDRKQAEEDLRKAKDELEVRVRERTEELSRALQELRTETEERIHAVEELRKKEQMLIQQSRLAAMGEMLVNISHQWRQPLTILGLILQELLRNYQRGKFTGEYLEANVGRGKQLIAHMSQTIDDFRNFFMPEKRKLSFDVKEVVERTVGMVQASMKEVQVDLQLSGDPITIDGYRNEYAQVIINILMNARDAFREREIANPGIIVRIFKENNRAVVTISDNAGGIPLDVIDKVFDPYFTTKAPDKGTGIGLFMSKTIIEKNMNGLLTVQNTDTGAEFRIEV